MAKLMLRIPPPIWALIYVLATGAISWGGGMAGLPRGPHSAKLGLALAAIGLIPAVWAVVLFRRAGTEIEPTSKANTVLVVSGPYRMTRNPMYLGLVVVSLGLAIWAGAWPMWLAPVLIFATVRLVHIPFEEAKMRRQYGQAFDAYAGRVPRWI